ncbi:cellulase family glycosylhydrolase [Actinoplanes sp. DH11]|uniref:cellulase family glycosylhydrolase n=1 Tax=Actinoplanes sp. DH11 TaxID=2857011 RepID=UPI001E648686|nr:cellulase family glycosylhydrolase [Actinoplanes sp. DH11]
MKTVRSRAAIVASSLLLAVIAPAGEATAATKPAPAPKATTKTSTTVKTGTVKTGTMKIQGGVVTTLASRLDATLAAKTINYYPSNAGWSAMWTSFDAARIEADMAKAAALGADNVRVIVFPQSFGYPTPKAEYTERLRKFISIADSYGLTVKLTLFDWWAGYGDATGSAAWAKAVLSPYANDPRVISVELKNEFNPSDAASVTWVKKIIPAVRAAVPTMPLTLSVDGQSGAPAMAKIKQVLAGTPLDYYDFHFYGTSERSLAEIRKAQAAVSPSPIVIGETGVSTASGSEGEQAAFLARVFTAAQLTGVASVAPWTLNDFSEGAIPSNSQVSKLPAQYKFGLYRADGTAKPAAAVVRTAWTGGKITNGVLDLGFEAAAGNSPWRPYLAEQGSAVRVRDVARTGSGSARFSGTGRSGSNIPSVRTSPVTPVQPGKAWHAEAWAKGLNVTGSNEIALSWFDANDKWLGQNSSKQVAKGTSGWTKLTVDAVAPAGAASVQLHLKSGDNTGTVWFDDVSMS